MNDDMIFRQAAIDALIRKMRPQDNGDGTMVVYIMSGSLVEETLNDLPSAQPEIIRCKDCRYKKLKGIDYYCDHITGEEIMVSPKDYCSWAERRTDE